MLTYLATIGLFAVTFGKKILVLLKSAKFLTPFLSMIISVGAYALISPLWFAVGIVVLLLIHELGHVWAAKIKGLPVSAPLFIPFLGALITLKRNPRDAETEAFVAIGGPIVGTLGSLAFLWLGLLFVNDLLIQLAYLGLLLNLVNLLPIHPLDGGRISVAVSRWLWLLGLIGGLVLIVFVLQSILFFIIWAFFARNLFEKYVLKRQTGQKVHAGSRFSASVEPPSFPGWAIPGEEHRRNLPWSTFSSLDGRQTVTFAWEGLDFQGEIEVPSQCLVERVHVTNIRHIMDESGRVEAIEIEVTVDAMTFENDRYYEVSNSVRWGYGIAYAGLAGLIFYVMTWIHRLLGV